MVQTEKLRHFLGDVPCQMVTAEIKKFNVSPFTDLCQISLKEIVGQIENSQGSGEQWKFTTEPVGREIQNMQTRRGDDTYCP